MSKLALTVVGAAAVVVVIVWSIAMAGVLSMNDRVTQTETFSLQPTDHNRYLPAEAIVTVTAPRTMHVGEGYERVDVKVDLVNHGNISGFRMQKINCYLGTIEGDRFPSTAADWHVFDQNGTHFETTFALDPKDAIHNARIMIALSVECYFEDGHSYYYGGFSTPAVFGFYEVQSRLVPALVTVPSLLIGAAIATTMVERRAKIKR